jgi:uncharacterized protein YgbK (DUF1537 family)
VQAHLQSPHFLAFSQATGDWVEQDRSTLSADRTMTLKLGCIADDFTGATDLANNLVRAGMRVVQTIGVPAAPVADVDAVVVALKSRTAPVAEAVADSGGRRALAARAGRAADLLQGLFDLRLHAARQHRPGGRSPAGGCRRDFALVTPAFPENGRTVFKGHLFVGDLLLSDSPMRHHPLTPMTDANLVRVLQAQATQARVGLIEHRMSRRRGGHGRTHRGLRREGVRLAIADALDDADLHVLAQATRGLKLVVAGSGLAIGIPALHGLAPAAGGAAAAGARPAAPSSAAAVRRPPMRRWPTSWPPAARPSRCPCVWPGVDMAQEALAWAAARLAQDPALPLLVYATAPPAAVQAVQAQLGAERAGALVEQALARVAQGLVGLGVRQLVLAGGETSGACMQALGITQLRIGPQIDPGVPWCHAPGASRRWLAPGAEVRQLRRPGLLHPRLHPAVTDEPSARGDLPRRPVAVRARLRARHGRQHQRAAGRRLPHHAHRCLPGPAGPGAAGAGRRRRTQTGGDRASKTLALHRASTKPHPMPPA